MAGPVVRSSSAQSSRIGRKQNPAPANRTWPPPPSSGLQSSAPSPPTAGFGSSRRNQSERRARYSCTLVCQLAASGSSHMVRQPRAQHAHLAGPGDVNQIRLESIQHFFDERNVAQKCRIEAQIFFQGKREKAARQLQRPHVAVFDEGLRAVPARTHRNGRFRRRANASKWRLVCATPFTSWNESGKYATRGFCRCRNQSSVRSLPWTLSPHADASAL